MGKEGWWLLAATIGLPVWFGLVLLISDWIVNG